MPTWNKIVLAMMTAFGAVSFLALEQAHANSYATLDEAPAGGGELRLITPRAPTAAAVPTHAGRAIGFPLQHTAVEVEVHGVMAEVVVEQTFHNPYPEVLDAVYVFPLGPDAAVYGYEFDVGERTIVGQIAEREDARRQFEEAKAQGQTAGLLQQEKPNVFTQEVANLPPGEDVVVRLRYVELVDHVDATYELVFPIVVGPRYLPGGTTDPRPINAVPSGSAGRPGATNVHYLRPGERSGHDVEVSARIDVGVPLVDVHSTTHALVDGGEDGTARLLELDPSDTLPNKDLVLRWSAAGEKTAAAVLTHRSDRDGFVSIVVQPKATYEVNDIAPREVVLLIDASGSMGGAPMGKAKEVGRGILATLRPTDTVNILAFSDSVDSWRAGAVEADPASLASAGAFLDRISTRGSTQMLPAVRSVLKTRADEGRNRVVYLLSDGEVGNDDEILAELGRNGAGFRVYPVGIGAAPNRYLFERTAERARGFASYVGLQESSAPVVDALIERSTRPYLTDLTIDWGGLKVVDVVPEVLPDVQAGQPLVISGRYRKAGHGTAVLRGRVAGREVELPLEVTLPDQEDQAGVAYLWARRRIHAIRSEHLGQPDAAAQRDITDLGMQFGLVTDYTSFVAVDRERTQSRTGARSVTQAVELADGMEWDGVFGASSPTVTASASATPTPTRVAQATPRPQKAQTSRRRKGGSYGGGAIDPVTGLLLLGLGAVAMRRKD